MLSRPTKQDIEAELRDILDPKITIRRSELRKMVLDEYKKLQEQEEVK